MPLTLFIWMSVQFVSSFLVTPRSVAAPEDSALREVWFEDIRSTTELSAPDTETIVRTVAAALARGDDDLSGLPRSEMLCGLGGSW